MKSSNTSNIGREPQIHFPTFRLHAIKILGFLHLAKPNGTFWDASILTSRKGERQAINCHLKGSPPEGQGSHFILFGRKNKIPTRSLWGLIFSVWRRGGDSNSRYLSVHTISSRTPSASQSPLRRQINRLQQNVAAVKKIFHRYERRNTFSAAQESR